MNGALGIVHPFFDNMPPDWLLKSQYCERPVLQTETVPDWSKTRTGNVFFKREVFDKHRISFDLKSVGPQETIWCFFNKAMKMGHMFVAVEEAPVYEVVSNKR